jgi:hypothetical protein
MRKNSKTSKIGIVNTSPHPLLPAPTVKYDTKRRAYIFVRESVVARGLLPVLKAEFYPTYEKKLAKHGPAIDAKEKKAKVKGGGRGKAKSRGKSYGRLIDQQVTRGCIVMQRHALDVRMLLSAELKEFKLVPNGAAIAKDIKGFRARAEPATTNLFSTMHSMHLHPIATQYGVGSHALRVATQVDVVCKSTQTGELVPIEVKTGFMDGAKHTGHSMRAPFTKHTNCPFNQFQLQLLGTTMLLNTTLANAGMVQSVKRAYIMRASAGMVKVIPLDKAITEHEYAIRNAFIKRSF